MAGPFARLRRTGDAPAPDASTEAVPASTRADQPPATEIVPADAEPAAAGDRSPRFIERGRLRRRLRFVRRAREIALRDLGGLVFDLHRYGRRRGDLVDQKLTALGALDAEMRALESALDERREVTVLREPGLASCPRCGALHASDASFCSTCGLPLGAHAGLPAGPTPTGPAEGDPATGPRGAPPTRVPGEHATPASSRAEPNEQAGSTSSGGARP